MIEPRDMLFDASSYPGYAEMKRRAALHWDLVLVASIFLWPIVIALMYLILPNDTLGSGFSKDALLLILIALWAADVALTYWLRKKPADRSARPVRITAQGIELANNRVILASEISKVRIGPQGEIGLYVPGKRIPVSVLSKQQLGNADEFIRMLKNQNPLLEIEDVNEELRKCWAEIKAEREARKGL